VSPLGTSSDSMRDSPKSHSLAFPSSSMRKFALEVIRRCVEIKRGMLSTYRLGVTVYDCRFVGVYIHDSCNCTHPLTSCSIHVMPCMNEYLRASSDLIRSSPGHSLRGIDWHHHSCTTGALLNRIVGRAVILREILIPLTAQRSFRLPHNLRRGQYSDSPA